MIFFFVFNPAIVLPRVETYIVLIIESFYDNVSCFPLFSFFSQRLILPFKTMSQTPHLNSSIAHNHQSITIKGYYPLLNKVVGIYDIWVLTLVSNQIVTNIRY